MCSRMKKEEEGRKMGGRKRERKVNGKISDCSVVAKDEIKVIT